jgi:hypothetical protein
LHRPSGYTCICCSYPNHSFSATTSETCRAISHTGHERGTAQAYLNSCWRVLDLPSQFEIAERLSGSLAESIAFRSRINNRLHSIFNSHSPDDIDDERDLFAGDIAPGSLDAPSVLPKALTDERDSFFRSLCVLFHGSDGDSSGYEGKEGELKRPSGMRQWSHALGGFRR